jgi:hypothetical protein
VTDDERCEAGTLVDEGRREREAGADEQADRDRHLEAGVVGGEEHPGCPDGVEAHEASGRHEREREEQHARVTTALRRLAGRVAEGERDRADQAEEDEMDAVVLEVRVELRPQEQRYEPDQRQGGDKELCDRSDPDPLPSG